MNASQLYELAFARAREPRSEPYKLGVLETLKFRMEGDPLHCPYSPGSAQADAWFAGVDEGQSLWRRHLNQC